MIDYEETKEDAILSFEQQIKQLVKDAFDKGYQCGYKDRKSEPQKGEWIIEVDANGNTYGKCSICGMRQYAGQLNFCPDCGARMKGAINETAIS